MSPTGARIALALALLAGCGETSSGCEPGATVACDCPEGTSGNAVCRDDRTYGACECVIALPDTAAPEVLEPSEDCVDAVQDAARRAGQASFAPPYDPLDATTERLDTDGDGIEELVVAFADFCGNAPTCRHWVYAPAGGPCQVFVRTWDRPMQ